MTRHACISKPAKSAMQSGRGKSKQWLLDIAPADPVAQDPLMGWAGSHDTDKQLRLWFVSKEAAIAFAQAKGLSFTVLEPHERVIRPKAYADNFAFNRVR
jgi:hypothetical protein